MPKLILEIFNLVMIVWVIGSPLGAAAGSLVQTQESSALVDRFETSRQKGFQKSSYLKSENGKLKVPELKANLDYFKTDIQPLLAMACSQCHGKKKKEGNIRIDLLDPDLFNGKDVQWWLEMFAVINNSEMPPPEDNRLSEAGRVKILEWLTQELKLASIARKNQKSVSSFRRLTRYEFNYALQDLLGLPYEFARDLPKEALPPGGFKNSSEALRVSASQLEMFRKVARRALDRAVIEGERPQPLFWGYP
ncbi:MAG: DUF1587 domain-containing protein [Planctomycetota bacterium]|nr:DUF1587 domain-containing protein [Planctomycetota bacterium]